MKAATLMAVASLFMLPVAGQIGGAPGTTWNQLAGGPERNGAVEIASGPLDVISSFSLLDELEVLGLGAGPVVLDTHHGLTATAYDSSGNQCFFIRVADVLSPEVEKSSPWPCSEASTLVAYSGVQDTIIVCHAGAAGQPILQAYDGATWDAMWGVTIGELKPRVPALRWVCSGAALMDDDRSVIVPFRPTGEFAEAPDEVISHEALPITVVPNAYDVVTPTIGVGVLAKIDVGRGTVSWHLSLDEAPSSIAHEEKHWRPATVTLTQTGMVVVGVTKAYGWVAVWYAGDLTTSPSHRGAWSSVAGNLNPFSGAIPPDLPNVGVQALAVQAGRHAVSSGPMAFAHMGQDIIAVNPANFVPQMVLSAGGGAPAVEIAAPVTWQGIVVLQTNDGLIGAQESNLGTVWGPHAFPSAPVMFIGLPGDLYVLGAIGGGVVLEKLGLTTGVLQSSFSVPLTSGNGNYYGPRSYDDLLIRGESRFGVTPLSDGVQVAIWDMFGTMVILGQADSSLLPDVTVDNLFPRPGGAIKAVLPPGPVRYTIGWGDGATGSANNVPSVTHSYQEAGAYVALFTAIYDDGRTATKEILIDVGGTPPANLNWVQKAAQPENYDLTFGVLGLAIAVAGALIAFARARRRRNRISRELDTIERAAEAAKANPAERAAAMNERRAHVRGLLLDGRIDESQLRILEDRIDELSRGGRIDSLRGRFDYLPHGFVMQVQEMLSDGRLSGWEYDQLDNILRGDKSLTEPQKKRVRGLLADWAKEDSS